jgi:hypothetical protein
MDHPLRIEIIIKLNFIDIIEHFQMKNIELDIETVDDDE